MSYLKNKHRGLREYSGEAAGNATLGQGGVDVVEPANGVAGSAECGAGNFADVKQWVGLTVCCLAATTEVAITVEFNKGSKVAEDGARTAVTLNVHAAQTIYAPIHKISFTGITGLKVLLLRG